MLRHQTGRTGPGEPSAGGRRIVGMSIRRPGRMAYGGLHPNDEGYAVMLREMDVALSALGL